MKHVTLITLLFSCLAVSAVAQTNSELSGNRPNSTKTGYVFEFNGTSGFNCPSQIPSDAYGIYDETYVVNSIGDGILSLSTTGTQETWHRINLRFTEDDCVPISLDLSNAANHKVEIKLNSSVAVPQLMIQFSDNTNFSDGNPPIHALVAGTNTITLNAFDFTGYNTNPDVDSLQVTHVSLFFRKQYDDASVAGDFDIDYIRVGDVTELVTSSTSAQLESSLNYFPNPANDHLNVKFSYNGSAKVVLADLTGKTVKEETVATGIHGLIVDTKDLLAGLYILSIVTEEGSVSKKVVIANK